MPRSASLTLLALKKEENVFIHACIGFFDEIFKICTFSYKTNNLLPFFFKILGHLLRPRGW
jgi:hypothetical protein